MDSDVETVRKHKRSKKSKRRHEDNESALREPVNAAEDDLVLEHVSLKKKKKHKKRDAVAEKIELAVYDNDLEGNVKFTSDDNSESFVKSKKRKHKTMDDRQSLVEPHQSIDVVDIPVKKRKKLYNNQNDFLDFTGIEPEEDFHVPLNHDEPVKKKKKHKRDKSVCEPGTGYIYEISQEPSFNSNSEVDEAIVKKKKRDKDINKFDPPLSNPEDSHKKKKKKKHRNGEADQFEEASPFDESEIWKKYENLVENENSHTKQKKKHKGSDAKGMESEVSLDQLPEEVIQQTYSLDEPVKKKKHKRDKSVCEPGTVDICEISQEPSFNTNSEVDEAIVKKKRDKDVNKFDPSLSNSEGSHKKKKKKKKKKHKNDEAEQVEETQPFDESELWKRYENLVENENINTKQKEKHKGSDAKGMESEVSLDQLPEEVIQQTCSLDEPVELENHHKKKKSKKHKHKEEKHSSVGENIPLIVDETCHETNQRDLNIPESKIRKSKKKHKQNYEECVEPSCFVEAQLGEQDSESNEFAIEGKSQQNDDISIIIHEETSDVEKKKEKSNHSNMPISMSGTMDLSQVEAILERLDIVELPVNFEVPNLHQRSKLKGLTKEERADYVARGISIRDGRYTKKERETLIKNWERIRPHLEIQDPAVLLGCGLNGIKPKQLVTYVNTKHLYVHLARGLESRTLFSVYKQARSLFTPGTGTGRLTQSQVKDLKQHHAKHGRKWTAISELLDKTPNSCAVSFRSHQDGQKSGAWSKDEEERLTEAVRDIAGENIQNVAKGTTSAKWSDISKLVVTRNPYQCRSHWLEVMSSAPGHPVKSKWTKTATACLIFLLYKDLVDDITEVDWTSMFEHFKRYVFSYAALMKKWVYVKSEYPLLHEKTHKEIVTFMFQKVLPRLMTTHKLSMENLFAMTSAS